MVSGVLFQYLYFKRIMVSVQLISCPIWFHPMLPITSEEQGTRKVHGVIAVRMTDHKLHSRLPNNLYFLTGLKKVAIGNVAKKHDQSTDAHMYDLVKLTVRTQPGVA